MMTLLRLPLSCVILEPFYWFMGRVLSNFWPNKEKKQQLLILLGSTQILLAVSCTSLLMVNCLTFVGTKSPNCTS